MNILKQFAKVFLLFWVSHGISTLLPFTMPASVIGLVLMFALLLSGVLTFMASFINKERRGRKKNEEK